MAKQVQKDPNALAFAAAWQELSAHPMFRPLTANAWPRPSAGVVLVDSSDLGYAEVSTDGRIRANRGRRLDQAQWTWVLAHCLLHLGFGHLDPRHGHDAAFRDAACVAVTRFQRAVKLGSEPELFPVALPKADEAALVRQWRLDGVPAEFAGCGAGAPDLVVRADPVAPGHEPAWPDRFALGLSAAATAAVDVAGGARTSLTDPRAPRKPWERALSWFVGSYPLLGGLAAGFTLVADTDLARGWDITVAAVSSAAGEIYVNPLRELSEAQWRFVLAHEMLHVALRHADRVGPRDPYLWNVACDYVVNGWLVEMGVGELPDGLLLDPALGGASAEEVYDRIATDLRRLRKLATLRGRGLGDMLGEPLPWRGSRSGGVDLDDFYRRALLTGYRYHQRDGRGLLPTGLAAEIRVLEQPPPPWDVQLARWFDEHVPGPERQRTYARPSRRQAATPGIPRPGRHLPEEVVRRHTFGVLLDTSGSMSHELMGKALGAIASYAAARDVPAARVVFCDAAAYDAGYLPVHEIAGRVRVRGRGGTVLQPGIDLLERAPDFPPAGPLLVITDGHCDVLRIRRAHAYLMPRDARLPFPARGPVFSLR
jgi:predicted metal-dependent peptidase